MSKNSKFIISILLGLIIFNKNLCFGQIDFQASVYPDICKINQKVKFGKFGCHYKILHKLGIDKRIVESLIIIPNKGSLKIEYDYNEHGDISYEQISFNSKKIEVKYQYIYDIIKPEHHNLTLYLIAKQTTTINNLEPIEINSLQGKNSYEILKAQLRNLKIVKDQAIFELLEEYPKTKTYNLPACNCQSDFELELVDQIYGYKLFNINDKYGASVGSGRRNGSLHYIGDTKKEKWRLKKTVFNYNQSGYVVETYKYKK